jgi:hypothetical protein
VLIVAAGVRRLQARLLRAELPRCTVLEPVGPRWLPPPLRGQPLVLACAESPAQARQWFAALLASGLRPVEFRCDDGLWQPWRILRQDDNGNRFEVENGLTEECARERVAALAAGGHKQLYWAEPEGNP